MSRNPGQAYEALPPEGNPAETEAWALTKAARKMIEAQSKPEDIEGMLTAARINWQLWTIFQAELLDPACPVPEPVRSNMINLSNFIDKHTVGLIAEPDPKKLDVLININRQIASGLYEGIKNETNKDAAHSEAPAPQGLGDISA